MQLLHKEDVLKSLGSDEADSLFIDPLLASSQIGEVTIDLRLGYDFLVSILTRKPYIGLSPNDQDYRIVDSYFQATRREIGDRFILYPNQIVLTTTLEYFTLPSDMFADVLSRSSYTRLGIHVNTMIQPGFRGCFPVELFNHGNSPVELVVGSRLFQTRLFRLGKRAGYQTSESRKYYGNVRPVPSRAALDRDMAVLEKIRRT